RAMAPAPQYVVGPAYTAAPMQAMPAPHYQPQNAFSYVPYQSPPPTTPVGSPFRQDYHQDRQLQQQQQEHAARVNMFRRGSQQEALMSSPPATRRQSVASCVSTSTNPNATAKTITYNETINPADRVNFETDVDELMKAIQRKKDAAAAAEATQGPTPIATPKGDVSAGPSSPASCSQVSVDSSDNKPKKKWVCDGPSCNKSFVQKTHLDIHRRTHTGARPYVCSKPNCGLTFSQRGNLKTHMRRHTGEKPFSCRLCGKLFAQRGNVRSHEETHKGLKPFVCRLDDCNKTFSQLGNMKTHQNNFHKETLKGLTGMFIQLLEKGEVPDEHRDLFDYFQEHYKNSNKGVKARTVAERKPKSKVRAQNAASMLPPQAQQQQPLPPAMEYDMSQQAGYAMFDHSQGPNSAMLYDDEHARQMAFTDRLY
ncbi:hypothetical protein Golomagni_06487, partial [Golovinomyces magnicellulatus]